MKLSAQPDDHDQRASLHSLNNMIGVPLEIGRFLPLAVGITAALKQTHQGGLVHKDIKPPNILVSDTGEVQLTGFDIASRLPRERQLPDPPEFIAGTLAYMAPEQTGRMNRSIDARSDLYALGVTFYEMITGSLPFTASDPIEWVHCHIAKQPQPPIERRRDIPRPVSAIIIKLLAKTPEGRYQTAAGVESDLRRCLEDWDRERGIDEFPLGEHDRPDHLLISEKLYGREREVETLLASFARVVNSGAPELVLVSGHSGIGKSSVVSELHKVLVPPRGLFASGKFDQYKSDIPYSTLAQALQSLIRRLLSKSEDDLAPWQEALRKALDQNGRLMIDLVPELKLIIGEQPPVPELPPHEAQRRFQLVFRRFIGVFARPEHPLALFLDDLQWLDPATLEVLEDLLTQEDVQHLLVIGAYRDNEVDSAHPLTRKLESIRKAGTRTNEIRLAPLSQEDVAQLITDGLQSGQDRTLPLAQLIYRKTAGNPFFTLQFISELDQEKLLSFDYAHGHWCWDLGRIHAKGYTDNVVDLMVGKLRRLPPETQRVLQELACLGNGATVTMLSLLYETEEAHVHSNLFEAVRTELVERQEGSYKFIHDRVQEAAYSLIPEAQRTEAHLRIGRLLATHTPGEKREETIFEIVNQFNRGAALITSPDEKNQLAEFNLIAGKRAKAATAYFSALKYLVYGATLLSDDGWEQRPDLMFSLELHRAECEFLTGELAAAEKRSTILSSRAVNPVDQATVASLRIDLYTTLDRSDRAIDVCLDYLRKMGVDWSPHPTEKQARQEYDRIWSLLGCREIEELIDLPLMSTPEAVATLGVLNETLGAATFTDANLFSMLVCRIVNLSLEHGNTDASCFAYGQLALIAGPRFGNYKAGFRFGRLDYDLVERRGLKKFRARTYCGFAVHTVSWTKHWRMARDLIRDAIDAANAIGDFTFVAYAWQNLIGNLLAVGDPLIDVQREAERGLEISRKIRFGLVIDTIVTQLALIVTLRGSTATFGCFNGAPFDELQFERHLSSDPGLVFAACWYWIRKLQARFFAGDYASAVDASLNAKRLLWISPYCPESAEAHFYGALSHAASYDAAFPAECRQHLEALTAHHKQLLEWAEYCPENFENRIALVGAEIARIEGRELNAERLYEKAIHSARANSFVHNEALAYERASAFYRARGFDEFADIYLRNARACYLNWGAEGKVRQLDDLYPQLAEKHPRTGDSTIETSVEHLDLATIMKVSQAVSGEMVLQKLINVLMRMAIEHAGAERGLLIVVRDSKLSVEAEAQTVGDTIVVRLRGTPLSADLLPESIVRSVVRTEEGVILDDALVQKSTFSADPYFLQHQTRSILCLPLINQRQLIAVLYLENNLASRVFTPSRAEVLKVLASQAAIALENSRLYSDLKVREAKIRRLIEANIIGICIWNLDGDIIEANEGFRKMLGYEPKDVAPARIRWAEITPPEWRDADARAISEVTTTGTTHVFEKEYFRKDGSRVPVLLGAALFESGGNEGVAFVLDMSEQKQAQVKLEKALDEIKQLKDRLQDENVVLREQVNRAFMFEEIVGASPALKAVLSRVSKVAGTDSTVLLTGETGTGKELIARAIHKRSQRSSHPFVSVNCAAIPASLIPSELFGHEKGAFTGAVERRVGRFEVAEEGTIFLDEVGELPAETQIALLRVLQEREFERVGGNRTLRANVRVVAATNRDLETAIVEGTFRSDLFYRLNVFPIEIPPLRERKEDIPLLVEYFVSRFARKAGKSIHEINKKTLDLLLSYPWPGNIRELQNVVERSVIVCETKNLSVDENWLSRRPVASQLNTRLDLSQLAAQEKKIIEAALRESGGRVSGPSGAAAKLGIPGSTLESKIRSLRINKNRFRANPDLAS